MRSACARDGGRRVSFGRVIPQPAVNAGVSSPGGGGGDGDHSVQRTRSIIAVVALEMRDSLGRFAPFAELLVGGLNLVGQRGSVSVGRTMAEFMKPYKVEFIEFALSREVLAFGSFTLKSGRESPYFFNFGKFQTGKDLAVSTMHWRNVLHSRAKALNRTRRASTDPSLMAKCMG